MDDKDGRPDATRVRVRRVRRVRLIAALRLAVLVLLALGMGAWALTSGEDSLSALNDRVGSLGVWAPLVFALFFALAQAAFVPGSVLTASAGVLFGVPMGVLTSLAGATAGAALSFVIARRLGRGAVVRLAGSGRLAQLDEALSRRGFWAVLAVRLVPVFPFALVNYGAGVTGVRFAPYLAATVLGILPATFAYVGVGGSLGDPGSPVLWIALAGLALLSAGGWWAARRTLGPRPEQSGPVLEPGLEPGLEAELEPGLEARLERE